MRVVEEQNKEREAEIKFLEAQEEKRKIKEDNERKIKEAQAAVEAREFDYQKLAVERKVFTPEEMDEYTKLKESRLKEEEERYTELKKRGSEFRIEVINEVIASFGVSYKNNVYSITS